MYIVVMNLCGNFTVIKQICICAFVEITRKNRTKLLYNLNFVIKKKIFLIELHFTKSFDFFNGKVHFKY